MGHLELTLVPQMDGRRQVKARFGYLFDCVNDALDRCKLLPFKQFLGILCAKMRWCIMQARQWCSIDTLLDALLQAEQ